MRLIQCPTCKTYAMNPPTQGFPDRSPVMMGSITSNPLVVYCARHKGAFKLTMTQFNSLPEMQLEEYYKLGFVRMPTRDLEGFGLQRSEAEDAFRRGWDVLGLHAISRDQEQHELHELTQAHADALEEAARREHEGAA